MITLGITVLLGGTGMTALYFGGDSLMVEGGENAIGAECTDVLTMVVKTPNNHLRLRKFIRMETTSGHERIRTALRISGLLAKTYQVDLIHVSVLDTHGPSKRAEMRARAIGAEVLIALKPDNLPEMKSPAMASYYEGPVSDAGQFYGDKVVVDIDEIGSMMTAMRTIEEKPDCVNPAGDAETAKNDGHGKTDKKDGHAKPNEKPANDHGEKPAEDHGEKPANDHGAEPAKEGADEAAEGADPAKEQSFLDSMLSMVGLGGSEPAAQTHEPVAEEPADAATDGHGGTESAEGHDKAPVKNEGHETSDAKTDPAAEDHSSPAKHEAVAEEPADASGESHDTAKTADGHEEKPAASEEHKASDAKAEPAADDQAAPAEEAHAPAPAEDEQVAEEAPADETADHDKTPAKVDAHAPADAKDHGNAKKPKADEHAEAYMPVGD